MRYGLVLVKIGAARPIEVLEDVKVIDGVIDAYPVFDRFDSAAFIREEDYYRLENLVVEIAGIKGIKSTYSTENDNTHPFKKLELR